MAIQPATKVIAILIMAIIANLAWSNVSTNAHETGRYTMIETDDGVIRLDQQDGTITNCKKTSKGWSCTPVDVPDTSGLTVNDKSELLKLRKENSRLRNQIAELTKNPDYKPDFFENEKEENRKLKLPSDEEVDAAIDYMERMIKKFGGAIKRMREKNESDDSTEL